MRYPWTQRWRGWICTAGVGLATTTPAESVADPAGSDPNLGLDPGIATSEEDQLLAEALEATAMPAFWSTSGAVRAVAGYRDNVLLSPFNAVAAPFVGLGADFIASRLPTDGTEVTLLASGEYTVFLDAPEAEPEALVLAQAGVTRELDNRWTCGLTGEYVFLHQVFDVSVTEAALSTVTARGNTFTLTPTGALDFGGGWGISMESDGTRQLFTEPLDDYWEVRPSVAFKKVCGSGAELALVYTFGYRWYDTRAPLDAEGGALPGLLEFAAHEVELRSTIFWDTPRHWQTQLRLGWLENDDNGGGYFDFTRLAAAARVQYRAGRWTVRVDGKVRWYSYPIQRTEGPDSSLRARTDLAGSVRCEFKASRKLRLFVQYERDASEDNTPDASYDANGLTAGVELDL
jgi:hypothetical protein